MSECNADFTAGDWVWGNFDDISYGEVPPDDSNASELVALGPPDEQGSQKITEILYLGPWMIPSIGDKRLIVRAPKLYTACVAFIEAWESRKTTARAHQEKMKEVLRLAKEATEGIRQ